MRITIDLNPEKTKELEDYIRIILPDIINENIFADRILLNNLVKEYVKGQIKATITELLQGKDFRNYLRDIIMEQIFQKREINSTNTKAMFKRCIDEKNN